MCLAAAGCVCAPGGLAGGLERGPLPGVRQEPAEEVFSAVLRNHVCPPPAEPGRITGLASPGDQDLDREDGVEVGHWPPGLGTRKPRQLQQNTGSVEYPLVGDSNSPRGLLVGTSECCFPLDVLGGSARSSMSLFTGVHTSSYFCFTSSQPSVSLAGVHTVPSASLTLSIRTLARPVVWWNVNCHLLTFVESAATSD